jgi:hypothetical protein
VSHGHDDYQVEPIRGLPAVPPAGERILWQGAPGWWPLAKQVFHVRAVGVYMAALLAWRGGVHLAATGDPRTAMAAIVALLPVTLLGLGLLCLIAWLSSRTSVYTITNRRVVLRVGIALPIAINVPFARIAGAALSLRADGSGDIACSLAGDERIAYSTLWPHVRPWHLRTPEPTLRAIPEARRVADLLGAAMRQAAMSRFDDCAVAVAASPDTAARRDDAVTAARPAAAPAGRLRRPVSA